VHRLTRTGALFLVDAKDAGVALREFRLVDDTAAGELVLTQAAAQPLANPEDSTRTRLAIQGTVGWAAVCADMSGAAQAAFDLAMDYLRTRKQFGRLIGENQALRHRASEMLVSLEMARSMAMAAAVAADDASAEDSAPDLHRAKLSVARNARNGARRDPASRRHRHDRGIRRRALPAAHPRARPDVRRRRRPCRASRGCPSRPTPSITSPMPRRDGDEVLRVAQQAATGFEQLGVSEGDTVALLLRNDFAFFEVQQAAAAVGAYGVPLNWHGRTEEVIYVLEDAKPKVLVAHADLLAPIRALVPAGIRVFVVPTPPEKQRYGVSTELARPLPGDTVWREWAERFEPLQAPPRAPARP
jgi:hypothetical protein